MLPNILPNNSIDTSAAQVLAQPSPVIEERPEDCHGSGDPVTVQQPSTQKSNHCANTSSKSGKMDRNLLAWTAFPKPILIMCSATPTICRLSVTGEAGRKNN